MIKEISFIVRNHNNGATLFRAICSIFAQNLPESSFEVILVDDHSTDGSIKKIGSSFLKKVRLLHAENKGAIHALNMGVQAAQGQWYFILDADDFLSPTSVNKMLFLARKQKTIDFVYGNYVECIENSPYSCYWLVGQNIYHTLAGGVLIRKKIAKKYQYYDESLFFPEYDLLKKMSQHHKFAYLPEVVYYYFRHRKSLTSQGIQALRGIEQLQIKYNETLPIRRYDW